MASEHHSIRLVDDTIVRTSGYIIKELEKGSIGIFGGRSLLLAMLIENDKEFVINSLIVIEEGANNGLDAEDDFVVYGRILNFGSIENGCVLVGGKLTLLGIGVIPLEAEVGDVFFHGKATGALDVVPIEIDA